VTSAPSAPSTDPTLPDVFVARQPIFTAQMAVYGYEMLFRSSSENRFASPDQEQASLSVIANSFFVFGIGTLAGDARAFINFTRETLLNDYAFALPRESLVVEITENVEPDDEVLAACARLKKSGYVIALDDYDQREDHPNRDELLEYVDIVKVDFMSSDAFQRSEYARVMKHRNIALLAEKVETSSDRDQALSLGYSYLQGYFFARPEILVRQQAPALRAHRMEIIRELHRDEPNMRKVEDLFRRDPDLSYKLLRHLNSAAFAFRSRIQTIWRALTILGERGMRAWTSVVVLAGLGGDHLSEVIVTSVTRARFCELIGQELRLGEQADDLFLMGLFSMIDVLTGTTMEDALGTLPLSDQAQQALLGKQNRFRQILELTQMYERGQWSSAGQLIGSLRLPAARMQPIYLDAVTWGNQSRHMH
jgi:EAL and modified HD-GYP domain-containing signal transduction protein